MSHWKQLFVPVGAVLMLTAALFAENPLSRPDTVPITPQVPQADRHAPGRIFLEQADSLIVDRDAPDVQIVVGNVMFRRGDMLMYCDSARFYTSSSMPTDSMEAFGNIRMEQGDTLFLFGDLMEYSGSEELTTVWAEYGREVKLINRDVTLTAPILYYSLRQELGYYDQGGTLSDPKNQLTSWRGEYAPSTKDANFYDDVELVGVSDKGDTVRVFSDILLYNTESRIAELTDRSRIVGNDGDILTTNGIFDTGANTAILLDRSLVHTSRGNTLTGDSLFYDRGLGFGEAFGKMELTDSAKHMTLYGDYGFYNEVTDSAYCTGHAIATEYSNSEKPLFLHGKEIRTFIAGDSARLMIANPGVRFWRTDLQGVCDSLTYVDSDSTIRMDYDPIVWSENREIFGNRIIVHMNDTTIEKAVLPDFGFMTEQIEDPYYNQLSGKEMIAYFFDGELKQLDVNGNVQAIMLPQENDSTYNKIANIESSFLQAFFKGRELERAKLWSESTGAVTPLFMAKRSQLKLPQFKWMESIRPTGPDDLIHESDSNGELIDESISGNTEVIERSENIGQSSDSIASLRIEEGSGIAGTGNDVPVQ